MNARDFMAGLPGHPTHPPLTDVVIGLYTGAVAAAVLSAVGVAEENLAVAWWLALVAGLVATIPTAVTGILDWVTITRGTPLFRTATAHLASMVAATLLLAGAAVLGHGGYVDREVPSSGLLLTMIGFGVVTLGGWLGGTIVYVHGMRVLDTADQPTTQAVKPNATGPSAAADRP